MLKNVIGKVTFNFTIIPNTNETHKC